VEGKKGVPRKKKKERGVGGKILINLTLILAWARGMVPQHVGEEGGEKKEGRGEAAK